MEKKDTIQLNDPSVYPDEEVLKAVLGRAYQSFKKLIELFDSNEMTHEWRYYNDGKAWLCKVQKKKRTIVWMSAWKGFMKATMYMPLRYIEEIYNLDIAEEVIEKIKETKNIGKSKPCTFEIRTQKVIKDFDKIMQFKLNNK